MYAFASLGSGTVLAEPNLRDPLPSQQKPGWEAALYQYPRGEIWPFMRHVGEKLWSPERPARATDVEMFRRSGKLYIERVAARTGHRARVLRSLRTIP